MKTNWLWDIRATEKEARDILKNEWNPEFYILAERLFGRLTDPAIVFSFIDKDIFCRVWPKIKNRLKKDKWLTDKMLFWDKVYKYTQKELQSNAIEVSSDKEAIAFQLRDLRIKLGYTQKDLAKKLGVIQQYISKIESGQENFSIDTLKEIVSIFNKKMVIKFI